MTPSSSVRSLRWAAVVVGIDTGELGIAALQRERPDCIIKRLEDESRQHYVRSEVLAMGYAAVGNFDKAFASLERAFQARSAGLIYLHVDPGYVPLRADPRFAELVGRIGLK